MPMRSTHLRLPEDELRRAKEAARAKGISLSEYVRGALAMRTAYERGFEAGWRERDAELQREEGRE